MMVVQLCCPAVGTLSRAVKPLVLNPGVVTNEGVQGEQ